MIKTETKTFERRICDGCQEPNKEGVVLPLPSPRSVLRLG
jgi:hypothetical protein